MTSRALPALLAAALATALLAGCGAGSRSPERPRAERASSTTTEAAEAADRLLADRMRAVWRLRIAHFAD
jgi:outer membrane murein-binding lipoprotein Lpp